MQKTDIYSIKMSESGMFVDSEVLPPFLRHNYHTNTVNYHANTVNGNN